MCYHLCAVEFRGQGRPLGVLSRRIPCREQLTYIYVYRVIQQARLPPIFPLIMNLFNILRIWEFLSILNDYI